MPLLAEVSDKGTYQASIHIIVPQFHSIAPSIRLTDDFNSGNGPMGTGWSLSAGSEITRTSGLKGVARYDVNDQFWLDGVELVPCISAPQSASCGSHEHMRPVWKSISGLFKTIAPRLDRLGSRRHSVRLCGLPRQSELPTDNPQMDALSSHRHPQQHGDLHVWLRAFVAPRLQLPYHRHHLRRRSRLQPDRDSNAPHSAAARRSDPLRPGARPTE